MGLANLYAIQELKFMLTRHGMSLRLLQSSTSALAKLMTKKFIFRDFVGSFEAFKKRKVLLIKQKYLPIQCKL